MAENYADMELISLHKRIKNTSANGTILTEPLQKTSRGPGTPKGQDGFLLSQGDQKKEGKEEEKKRDGACNPEGSRERGVVSTSGEETMAASVWQQDRVRAAHGYCPQPCPPSLRGCPLLQTRAGGWNVGPGEQTQAELCSGPWGDALCEWQGGRSSANRNAWGGGLNHPSAERHCWVMPKAKTRHCL